MYYETPTCSSHVYIVQLLRMRGGLYKFVKIYRAVHLKQVTFAVCRFYLNKLDKKEGDEKNIYQNFLMFSTIIILNGMSSIIPRVLCV